MREGLTELSCFHGSNPQWAFLCFFPKVDIPQLGLRTKHSTLGKVTSPLQDNSFPSTPFSNVHLNSLILLVLIWMMNKLGCSC